MWVDGSVALDGHTGLLFGCGQPAVAGASILNGDAKSLIFFNLNHG